MTNLGLPWVVTITWPEEVLRSISLANHLYFRSDDIGRADAVCQEIDIVAADLRVKDKDELAPWLSIPAGTPPIFLAHGGEDIISDPAHSVVAYLALKRAGVSAELHIYANSTHDFGVRPNDRICST